MTYSARQNRRPHVVADVMTSPVATAAPDADVAELTARMAARGIRSVPILENDEVIGIVSRRDLLRTMVRTDAMVSHDVQYRLDEYAGGGHRWTATVTDGVAEVRGEFDDDTERRVVYLLSRTVPGVVDVKVH
ncbi:MAG: CBS domain-containing protein [Micromonosporaceae bacterium]